MIRVLGQKAKSNPKHTITNIFHLEQTAFLHEYPIENIVHRWNNDSIFRENITLNDFEP